MSVVSMHHEISVIVMWYNHNSTLPADETSLILLSRSHDDVIKWKHFPRCWPFVRGIHRSPVNSPQKGQWRGVLMFSLICVWINGWVNNRDAGDFIRHRVHYDVIVMVHWNDTHWHTPWELWRLRSPKTWLFVQQFIQANNELYIKAPHHWPFLMGILLWPVDFPHKVPVMRWTFHAITSLEGAVIIIMMRYLDPYLKWKT